VRFDQAYNVRRSAPLARPALLSIQNVKRLDVTPITTLFRCRQLRIFLAALSAAFCLTGYAEPLRIVVAGDGRAEYPWRTAQPRLCDQDGINVTVAKAIGQAVANEHAAILLWTGDIALISDREDHTLENRLENWRTMMKQSCGDDVKIWPVRGNHEVYCYPDKTNYDGELIPDSAAVWRKVFPDLPQNDPKSDDGLSFYSIEGSTLIIGLDEYSGANADPLQRKHLVNQTWLDQVLTQNRKPFTFVYGHEAAFMAGRHTDDETLAANAAARNSFLQSLLNAKALYFCGHDHFYDRMSVVRMSSPGGPKFVQITAGTAGAPFYSAGPYAGSGLWKLERVAHFDNVYGYTLIEVDGDKSATVTFKGVPPSLMDKTGPTTFAAMDQIVCDASGCKSLTCDTR